MILILDACTFSNLINVNQDDSLIKTIKKCFTDIFIAREVVDEIDRNKFNYEYLYKDRTEIRQLVQDLDLSNYICTYDKDKTDCKSFVRKFARNKGITLREDDGEFHSALLSLYMSRWGVTDLFENDNKVLFATDDYGAKKMYKHLFQSNQVGKIIDSIDIICVLYLKKLLTKRQVISFLNGIQSLYSQNIINLKQIVEDLRSKHKTDTQLQAQMTEVIDKVYNFDMDGLSSTKNNYKKLYTTSPKLKSVVDEILKYSPKRKIDYIKERRSDLMNDLFWTVD